MTGINTNVEGKQTRIIARYSGSAPAYRHGATRWRRKATGSWRCALAGPRSRRAPSAFFGRGCAAHSPIVAKMRAICSLPWLSIASAPPCAPGALPGAKPATRGPQAAGAWVALLGPAPARPCQAEADWLGTLVGTAQRAWRRRRPSARHAGARRHRGPHQEPAPQAGSNGAGGPSHPGGPLALRQQGRRDVHRRHARKR